MAKPGTVVVGNTEWGVHHAGDTNEHHTLPRGWDLFLGSYANGQVTCWPKLPQRQQIRSKRCLFQRPDMSRFHIETGKYVWNDCLWKLWFTFLVVVQKKWFWWHECWGFPQVFSASFEIFELIKLNWRGSMCWPTLLVPSMFDTHGRVQRRTRQEAKVQIFVTFTNCFCFQLTTFPGAGCCGSVLNFLPGFDAVWDRIWSRELSSPRRVLMPWIMPCACNW